MVHEERCCAWRRKRPVVHPQRALDRREDSSRRRDNAPLSIGPGRFRVRRSPGHSSLGSIPAIRHFIAGNDMNFVDTHAHLDFPEFAGDLPEVLQRAGDAGVTRVISIGTDLESSRRAVALAERHAGVFAAVGWHPGHASESTADFRAELRALAAHPRVVAIGECGLDYHRLPSRVGAGGPDDDEAVKARQRAVFEQQLEVAAELGLNVVIHTRDSWNDTIAQFAPHAGRVRGVFHCFAGGPRELDDVHRLGALVSFTGILTFKNGANVRAALAGTTPGEYMLETDCPFLAPAPHRGQRCEPGYVCLIAEMAAQVTGRSVEAIAEETSRTAEGFFKGLRAS